MSGTSCLACQFPCLTCSINATNCNTCLPGRIFDVTSGSCINCTVKNCLNCSDLNVCQKCRPGFALTTTGTCRPCPSTCPKCNPLNITECLGC